MSIRIGIVLGVWLSVCGSRIDAAGPPAVDVVTLKSGKSVRGAILRRQPDGAVLMAVSREWLEQNDPREFDRLSKTTDEEQRAAWTDVTERIESLLTDPPESQSLRFFLKQELERIGKLLDADAPEPTPFLFREIAAGQIKKVQPAGPERQRMAIFAWDAGLTNVEAKSAAELKQELEAAGVDVEGPLPDLTPLLPVRKQSDAEWTVRLAIVRYTLDEALDFQGMDDTLVRTGEGQEIQLTKILPKLLTKNIDSLLGDLLEPGLKPKPQKRTNSYASAIKVAQEAGHDGFRVSRLDLNAEQLAVSVETEFVVRVADDDWQPVWKYVESADGTKVRPEDEARIAEDPQVKPLLKSIKDLGLGAEDAVTQAIRVGAATMTAQQSANAKFFEFRDRYVKRLDGPVLPVTR